MKFETPKLEIIRFDVKDIVTDSGWELPLIPSVTDPLETGWETPLYP